MPPLLHGHATVAKLWLAETLTVTVEERLQQIPSPCQREEEKKRREVKKRRRRKEETGRRRPADPVRQADAESACQSRQSPEPSR